MTFVVEAVECIDETPLTFVEHRLRRRPFDASAEPEERDAGGAADGEERATVGAHTVVMLGKRLRHFLSSRFR